MDLQQGAFRHEAMLYNDIDEFLRGSTEFIERALRDNAATLAVVSAPKIDALRARLGTDARHVQFVDMAFVGTNPARIIPVWRDLAATHARRTLRGIGEPAWPGRSPAELDEAHRHEQLLNLAFADARDFWLLCPYNKAELDGETLAHAAACHEYVDGAHADTGTAPIADYCQIAFGGDLPEPPPGIEAFAFALHGLHQLREIVETRAHAEGLDPHRAAGFVLAVDEAASNSVRYAGDSGTLQLWVEGARLVCEISDSGRMHDPLAGRVRPPAGRPGGRGLWIANQLCDLVQLRSSPNGTRVRLTINL